jgi:hypothetical protein
MTAILEHPESITQTIKIVDMQQDMISEAIKIAK